MEQTKRPYELTVAYINNFEIFEDARLAQEKNNDEFYSSIGLCNSTIKRIKNGKCVKLSMVRKLKQIAENFGVELKYDVKKEVYNTLLKK